MATRRAEVILRDRDIDTLPVNPIAIAQEAGIVVKPKPDTAPGVSGMLLRHGDSFGILYATHLPNQGFQRFSIGHELGHFFLDGHIDHVLPNGALSHFSRAGFESADTYEREADHFSAGLLMPSGPCRRLLARPEAGLAAVEAMAAGCRTSLTSTAIRYAALADDAVAVIMSTAGVVDYCFLSNTTQSLPHLTPPHKGSPVPRSTATHAYANGGARGRNARTEAECDVLDWLGGSRSMHATEEVLHLGSYGTTLTVLTIPSLLDETFRDEDEDEGGDADLEERWTPRFR